ncbi:MAG: hypothetical protein ACOCP8_03315 [archaeon]
MLYETIDEKELFKNIMPEINSMKDYFKLINMSNSTIETDLIDMINNEIHHIVNNQKNIKRLSNNMYQVIVKKIPNEDHQKEIIKIIKNILLICDRFKVEYLEKINDEEG